MPVTELIVNGDFDAGSSGWNGTDIEAWNQEWQYLNNGVTNTVAELDGNSGATTVMQQSFTVNSSTSTTLNFDAALRVASNPNSGLEGFIVEILDSSDNVIATTTITPTANSFTAYSLPVTFPSAGTYTVRFTEIGPDDALGAIIDNISMTVCFCRGTSIKTVTGEKLVEELVPGDRVLTLDSGYQPLRLALRRTVSAKALTENPKLLPVTISAGALGNNMPEHDLQTSRQHRMVVSSAIAERMFDKREVLVSAIRLTDLPGIYVDTEATEVEYFHLVFEDHQIVFANGAPSESFYPGEEGLQALTPEAREEFVTLFSDIQLQAICDNPVRPIPSSKQQKQLIARHKKNTKLLIGGLHLSGGRG